MDDNNLDVELNLTIQFEMEDDGRRVENPVSEERITDCFYSGSEAFGKSGWRKTPARIQTKEWVTEPGVRPRIPVWAMVQSVDLDYTNYR